MTTVPPGEHLAHVLDASALLALVHAEPGAERVREAVPRAAVSTVNWSEIVQKAARRGLAAQRQRAIFQAVGMVIVPLTAEDAETAASLWVRAPQLSRRPLLPRLGVPAPAARAYGGPGLAGARRWRRRPADPLALRHAREAQAAARRAVLRMSARLERLGLRKPVTGAG